MGFRTGSFCTVWETKPGRGNFTNVRLSISRKNKDTGEYETDFSGFCDFIGTAHAKAAMLKERSRITLGDVDVSKVYDAKAKREYINFKVFDFEFSDAAAPAPQAAHSASGNRVEANTTDDDSNRCPF